MRRPAAVRGLCLVGLCLVALAGCSSAPMHASHTGSADRSGSSAPIPSGPMAGPSAGGSSAGTSSAASPRVAAPVAITIKGFAFSSAKPFSAGATVTVQNQDSETHSVTSDRAGLFNVTVAPGRSATFTAPSTPGVYAYHCAFHSEMHGRLTVR